MPLWNDTYHPTVLARQLSEVRSTRAALESMLARPLPIASSGWLGPAADLARERERENIATVRDALAQLDDAETALVTALGT